VTKSRTKIERIKYLFPLFGSGLVVRGGELQPELRYLRHVGRHQIALVRADITRRRFGPTANRRHSNGWAA
jgi:hypothetical protein